MDGTLEYFEAIHHGIGSVRFHQKQSFAIAKFSRFDGLLSAQAVAQIECQVSLVFFDSLSDHKDEFRGQFT